MYKIRNIKKIYNGRSVLDIPSLTIQEGELLAVIGPSGAGKSTFLRLLHFLEYADAGDIFYRGMRMRDPAPLEIRREIGMVFQIGRLLSRNVIENVDLGLKLRGKSNMGRAREILEAMGLGDFAHESARTLSGGESQRVALARVLILQPNVLLLDEPTANLDPANVKRVEIAVREHQEKFGTTTVLVTHNIFQAKRLADRVAFFLGGNLIEVADAKTFFNNPADPRSLAFINGDMVY